MIKKFNKFLKKRRYLNFLTISLYISPLKILLFLRAQCLKDGNKSGDFPAGRNDTRMKSGETLFSFLGEVTNRREKHGYTRIEKRRREKRFSFSFFFFVPRIDTPR